MLSHASVAVTAGSEDGTARHTDKTPGRLPNATLRLAIDGPPGVGSKMTNGQGLARLLTLPQRKAHETTFHGAFHKQQHSSQDKPDSDTALAIA